MKLSTIGLIALVIFGLGVLLGSYVFPSCKDTAQVISTSREVVTVRDTVKVKTPEPTIDKVARVDVVRLPLRAKKAIAVTKTPAPVINVAKDSATVEVPISTKVYKTDSYRVVVSGFRVKLDSMEVYRDTRTITEKTVEQLKPRRKWFALSVGPSVGYDINGQIVPSVSLTLGLILISK